MPTALPWCNKLLPVVAIVVPWFVNYGTVTVVEPWSNHGSSTIVKPWLSTMVPLWYHRWFYRVLYGKQNNKSDYSRIMVEQMIQPCRTRVFWDIESIV